MWFSSALDNRWRCFITETITGLWALSGCLFQRRRGWGGCWSLWQGQAQLPRPHVSPATPGGLGCLSMLGTCWAQRLARKMHGKAEVGGWKSVPFIWICYRPLQSDKIFPDQCSFGRAENLGGDCVPASMPPCVLHKCNQKKDWGKCGVLFLASKNIIPFAK